MFKDPTIINAVKSTKNLILVDENMDFITASYFLIVEVKQIMLKMFGTRHFHI